MGQNDVLPKVVGFIASLAVTALGTAFIKDRWDAADLVVEVIDVRTAVLPAQAADTSPDAPPPAPMPYGPPSELRLNAVSAALLAYHSDYQNLCAREERLKTFIEELRRSLAAPQGSNADANRNQFLDFLFMKDAELGSDAYSVFWELSSEGAFPAAYRTKTSCKYPDYATLANGSQMPLADKAPAAGDPEPALALARTAAENQVRRWIGCARTEDLRDVLVRSVDVVDVASKQCRSVKMPETASAPTPPSSLVATLLVSNHGRDSGAFRQLGYLELTLPPGKKTGSCTLSVDLSGMSVQQQVAAVPGFESMVVELRSELAFPDVLKKQTKCEGMTAELLQERFSSNMANAEGAMTARVRLSTTGSRKWIASGETRAVGGNAVRELHTALKSGS
jgi:hypothetical protein